MGEFSASPILNDSSCEFGAGDAYEDSAKKSTYFKVTRPSFFGGVPSYFEPLWYPHLYFYRKSNT